MSNSKASLPAGIVFAALGLICVVAGIISLVYRLDDANATVPFLIDHSGVVMTMHQLTNIVIPVGFLGGIGAIGYGGWRIRGGAGGAAADES
jgi:hypothetical protein